MVESVLTRKTWEVSGLLSRRRVGSTDDGIRSTTLVEVFKRRSGINQMTKPEQPLGLHSSQGGVGLTDEVTIDRPLWHSSREEWDRSMA